MKILLIVIWVVACVLSLLAVGCVQRQYQHDSIDPNGLPQTRYYKVNYLMTDAMAEKVEIITPDGTTIRVNAPVQESQNVKVWTPWGLMEATK